MSLRVLSERAPPLIRSAPVRGPRPSATRVGLDSGIGRDRGRGLRLHMGYVMARQAGQRHRAGPWGGGGQRKIGVPKIGLKFLASLI